MVERLADQDLRQHTTLKDLFGAVLTPSNNSYETEIANTVKLAEEFGITPLQMGQLKLSFELLGDYVREDDDETARPFIELVDQVSTEIGEDKTVSIIKEWFAARIDEPDSYFPEGVTVRQAIATLRAEGGTEATGMSLIASYFKS